MSTYLDRIGAGLVIKRPDFFGFDYLPQILVGRDEIQVQLASLFSNIAYPNGASRAVVTGPVGSGKTAIVKRFCDDAITHFAEKRNIKSIYVNCRNAATSSRVMQTIVQKLDPGHPDRGLGIGELLTSVKRMVKGSNSHLIVTLDEVDHLFRQSGDSLIYQLMRIDEDSDITGSLSLIMISQEQILDLLENAVLSRIGRSNHIRMPPYDENGLHQIIEQRRELALVAGTCPDNILQLIAEAAAPLGDARQAIELLEGAAKRAEAAGRSMIEPKDVQKTVIEQPANVDSINIKSLDGHSMLILLGICRRLKNKESLTSGEAEKLYHVACEEYEVAPKGHTTFWKKLKNLSDNTVVNTRTSNAEVGRGRTQHISMTQMLPSDVARRLETLIPSVLKRK